MKDCFGLHGHSAFGSVSKRQIGVGRKSATSVGLTTDLIHWLQADKTVDISRCASESTDLLPPSALLRPRCGLQLPRPPALRLAYYRLPPVIVLPLWFFVFIVVVVLMSVMDFNQKDSSCAIVLLLYVLIYYMGRRYNACLVYMVLVLLGIWRLLMIPA